MGIKTYKELVVWQKAIKLAVEVYESTSLLPKEERFGLIAQMRRAAVSIPSNIAEGFHRIHRAMQAQFMQIAYASAAELETQIELCKQLGFLTEQQTVPTEQLLDEVMRMLNSVCQKLRP